MKRIDAGKSGTNQPRSMLSWADLRLSLEWKKVIDELGPGHSPREIQAIAFGKERVLEHRRNLIISAPTNSGKSLIGFLVLLEAIQRGRRAVLLEPLRAIAREKYEELKALAPRISETFGRQCTIRISTGDYRIESDTFSNPPPDHGELIIATPERFEAILRNSDHEKWISTIGAVCVDEAHLISSPRRGPTLEYLLTSLLCLPAPPRLILLSASFGETDRLREWLSPCDVILSTERFPVLHKEVWELGDEEDANEVVINRVKDILTDGRSSVLVFVYQTKSAEKVAVVLNQTLSQATGSDGAFAYHGQMSMAHRNKARVAFKLGNCRCIVATTALGLGVNLPATHVIVRDSAFPGVGRLGISELLQMMGRAGRGDQSGHSAVIVRKQDGWNADELAHALTKEAISELRSHYDNEAIDFERKSGVFSSAVISIATHISALLARNQERGLSADEIRSFFSRSLGARSIVARIQSALSWLTDPSNVLAFRDERERYKLTTLGLSAARGILPLQMGAGVGQLIRDLLSIDDSDGLLAQWRPLDHLIVLNLLAENAIQSRHFSESLVEAVDAWMEENSQSTPLLYRQWIIGQSGQSRSVEVLGSLGINRNSQSCAAEENARREAYLAVFRSIILYELGNGQSIYDVERRWKLKGLDGVQERLRDDFLWMLSGLEKIFDVRCFYFHLKEECQADKDRIQRVKKSLRMLQIQTFELREHITYCSPLGPLLRSLRRSQINGDNTPVGIQSLRRLEDAGFRTLADLAGLTVEDMTRLGLRHSVANKIASYVRLRLN